MTGARRIPIPTLASLALVALLSLLSLLAACQGRSGDSGTGDEGHDEAPGEEVVADRTEDVAVGPAGCYTLQVAGDTAGAEEGTGRVPPGLLPRILGLDTARLSQPAVVDGEDLPAYAAHAFVGSRRQAHPFNRWVELPGDSLRVDHTGATAGVVLRLAITEDGLSGTARAFGDVMDGTEDGDGTFHVRGERTSCPGGGG